MEYVRFSSEWSERPPTYNLKGSFWCGVKKGLQGTERPHEQTGEATQVRDGGGLDQRGGSEGGEKCSDSADALKMEPGLIYTTKCKIDG